MNKTTALKTPSPHKQVAAPAAGSQDYDNYRREFFAAVMDLSWQMALVVLVPIVGGFELDQKFGISPTLTIAGFIVALAGMSLVVRRQLRLVGPDGAQRGTKGQDR
ncbi:MAG: AtpZ/AtpI family protein [Candidatus Saccharimonadales bacterium]